jgi:hypothetical protein
MDPSTGIDNGMMSDGDKSRRQGHRKNEAEGVWVDHRAHGCVSNSFVPVHQQFRPTKMPVSGKNLKCFSPLRSL